MTDTQIVAFSMLVLTAGVYVALGVLAVYLHRRMDSAIVALLAEGPAEISDIATAMGLTTRQAAVKLMRLQRAGRVYSKWADSIGGTSRGRLYFIRVAHDS